MDFSAFPLGVNLAVFATAAAIVAMAGVMMTGAADKLADRTGLGEAVIGAALLGASTSLSGTVTSISAAAIGHPDLAVSNAVGGIAAQTAFLAIADIAYRRANLEHAGASATNLSQAALLIVMLSLPLIAASLAPVTIFSVHPVSFALVAMYWFGLRLAAQASQNPMWRPEDTTETRADEPEADSWREGSIARIVAQFAGLALLIGFAGWVIAGTGIEIARETGLAETAVGAVFTAVATSFPELVTTLAAVRRGALQLAIGGIIGGNTFDVLFLVLSDVSYRPGSIYHAADPGYQFWIFIAILMMGVLLLGLLSRQRHGIANIGFESAAILLIYGAAVTAGVLQLV